MKLLILLFLTISTPSVTWLGNFNKAQSEARKSHKLMLINFSGSDWCGPCIRLKKEVLETPSFEEFASGHLVLVRADFPRLKKNQPEKEQIKLNEALAEKYNPQGKFPYTVLVDENGKTLKVWDGFHKETPSKFISDISHYMNAH